MGVRRREGEGGEEAGETFKEVLFSSLLKSSRRRSPMSASWSKNIERKSEKPGQKTERVDGIIPLWELPLGAGKWGGHQEVGKREGRKSQTRLSHATPYAEFPKKPPKKTAPIGE